MTGYRELLGHGGFRPYLLAGAFSFAAPSTLVVILVWATAVAYPSGSGEMVPFSALALALLGLSATVPTLAAAVVSGAIADRFDRRRLMQITNLTALLGTALLAVDLLMLPGTRIAFPGPSGFYLPLWMVIAFPLWAAVTTSATLFRPAFNAAIPTLLSTADLGRANGLIYGIATGASVAGSLLATGLITWASEGAAVAVPLGLFAVTGVAIAAFGLPRPIVKARRTTRFSADLSGGYRYLWRNRALLQVTVASLLINFLSALAFVELGLYVRDWLGVGEAILLGAMTTGATAGSGLGTILAGRIRFEERAGRFLIVLTVLQGVAIFSLALSRSVLLSVPLMFLFGLFPGMGSTVFLATIQATVPNELLGRVLAADEVGSYALIPTGQYAGGLLTATAGVQAAYLAAGLGTVAIGGGMAAFRELRALGFRPRSEAPAAAPG
ncbi:MAG TPA: MFS transporter [Thermoplasmata archaeon]|nr:MFS transporter [Thermoplasmata archaeon]